MSDARSFDGTTTPDLLASHGRLLAVLVAAPLLLLLALPVAALLARAAAFPDLLAALGSAVVRDALVLSLVTTTLSLALTIIFGTPLAYVLARRRFRGSAVLETLVDLPIVLPPAVAGLSLLVLLGRRGPIGAALAEVGIELPFTTAAVVLAQTFIAAPFYVRGARAGFAGIEQEIEDAARVDGADESSVFRHVTVPLAAPSLSAGATLSWARALGEFGATIMFAGNIAGRTQTLPLVVYAEFQSGLEAAVAAAAVLVLAAFSLLLGVRLLRLPTIFEARPAAVRRGPPDA